MQKDLKKSVQSLKESISKLESQKTVAIEAGNKISQMCIERMIACFEKKLKELKAS